MHKNWWNFFSCGVRAEFHLFKHRIQCVGLYDRSILVISRDIYNITTWLAFRRCGLVKEPAWEGGERKKSLVYDRAVWKKKNQKESKGDIRHVSNYEINFLPTSRHNEQCSYDVTQIGNCDRLIYTREFDPERRNNLENSVTKKRERIFT